MKISIEGRTMLRHIICAASVAMPLVGVSSTGLAAPPTQDNCPASIDGHLDNTCRNHVGVPVCLNGPVRIPGYGTTMPQWPGAGLGGTESSDVSDPRWGAGPLKWLYSGDSGNAKFRMVADSSASPRFLAVSVQVDGDDMQPGSTGTYVYLGFSSEDGSEAWGVQIPAIASGGAVGQAVPIVAGQATSYRYTGGAWQDPARGFPAGEQWVTATPTRLWNDPDFVGINGADYAIELVVDLQAIGLNGAGDQPRVTIGVHNQFEGVGGWTNYFTPNLALCGDSCPTRATDPMGGSLEEAGPFHQYPAEWTPIAALGSECEGVNVRPEDIGTSFGRRVTVAPSAQNLFSVKPQGLNSVIDLTAGDIRAEFWMSNWGTGPSPASWVHVPNSPGVLSSGSATQIDVQCPNSSTGGDVCSTSIVTRCYQDLADEDGDGDEDEFICPQDFHQCLQVQLSASQGAIDRVSFGQPSAYINTRFGHLSDLNEVAQINVKGLQALLGNANDRDIYLLVKARNMPPADDQRRTMDVDALDALRAQVDEWYREEHGYCSNPNGVCVNSQCITPCDATNPYPCYPFGTQITYEGQCYCQPSYYYAEACEAPSVSPAGGGVNYDVSALNGSQKLRAEYPTLEVYPFYDNGKRAVIDGQTRVGLVAMPKFDMHVDHVGDFYGFLWGLTAVDGSALQRIGDEWYKITVPNEGSTDIRMLISAEEQPHYAPLTQIQGTATVLGFGLGNVQMTGTGSGSTALNLANSTIQIDSIIKEGSRELVSNFSGPRVLTPLPGATPFFATFASGGSPSILVEVTRLPLVGYVVATQVLGASVRQPSSCRWFGTTNLTTQFKITEGSSSIALKGTDQWSCWPFQLVNY